MAQVLLEAIERGALEAAVRAVVDLERVTAGDSLHIEDAQGAEVSARSGLVVWLDHLFPYLSQQPGYNKRMRALSPLLNRVLRHLAQQTPSWCDRLRLLDATPLSCASSRETVKRCLARTCQPRLLRQPLPLLLGLQASCAEPGKSWTVRPFSY